MTHLDDSSAVTAATTTAAAATDTDPRVGLRAVVALRRLVERLEDLQVRSARLAGWSWEEIGQSLGVSKQAVHKKYGQAEKGRR